MDADVDLVGIERRLDLLGKQAFAAHFAKRRVLEGVARGGDRVDLNALRIDAVRLGQQPLHQSCLHHGERRAAGSDAQKGRRLQSRAVPYSELGTP